MAHPRDTYLCHRERKSKHDYEFLSNRTHFSIFLNTRKIETGQLNLGVALNRQNINEISSLKLKNVNFESAICWLGNKLLKISRLKLPWMSSKNNNNCFAR